MKATLAVILTQLMWAGAASAQTANYDGENRPFGDKGLFGQIKTKAPEVPAIGKLVTAPGGDVKADQPKEKEKIFHWVKMKCADDGETGVDPTPASPPLGIDDADTPGCKVWEVNVHGVRDRMPGSTQWEAPVLDANYGIGANLQLKFEVPMIWLHEKGVAGTQKDLGNAAFGVKWQFLSIEKSGTSVAYYPQISFAPPGAKKGDAHLDSNTKTVTNLFIVDQDLGKIKGHEVIAVGNFAYNSALGGEESNSIVTAAGIGVRATNRVAIMGNIDSARNTSFNEHGIKEHEVMGRIGAMVRVTEWLNAYASAGHTIGGNMPPHTVMMAGAQFNIAPGHKPVGDGVGVNYRNPRLPGR